MTSAGTKSVSVLKGRSFACGQGMQKMWVESNEIFLGHIFARFGQSIKVSFLSGKVMVTEVDEDLIPRFDILQEENKHLAGIKHWEQKLYHSTL